MDNISLTDLNHIFSILQVCKYYSYYFFILNNIFVYCFCSSFYKITKVDGTLLCDFGITNTTDVTELSRVQFESLLKDSRFQASNHYLFNSRSFSQN